MTVSTTTNKNILTADGVMTVFPFNFALQLASDLNVLLNGSPSGISTTIQINSNGVGGTVTFAAPPDAATIITLLRTVDNLQNLHLLPESNFPETSLENALDKLTMEVQQIQEQLSRVPIMSTAVSGFNGALPDPVIGGIPVINSNATGFDYIRPGNASFDLTDNGVGVVPSYAPPAGGGGGGGNVLGPTPPVTAGTNAVWADTSGRVLAAGSLAVSSALKAFGIGASYRQLPTAGAISGTYYHYGTWTQTGPITAASNTKIFMNSGDPLSSTTTCQIGSTSGFGVTVSNSLLNPAITTKFGAPVMGRGLGKPQMVTDNAASIGGQGGGGAGFAGAGGSGGSSVANRFFTGGLTYDWKQQFCGSSGQSGATAPPAALALPAGGAAGGSIYWEVIGKVTLRSLLAPAITANGGAGVDSAVGNVGGGGGGSGGAIIFRVNGGLQAPDATPLQAAGGQGGAGGAGGAGASPGGGGGGGYIDAITTRPMTLLGCDVSGGAAGVNTGAVTVPATAGGAGVISVIQNSFPVSEF